ncbi:MAG: glycosyltransferase [Pseudomonadota bacterium]|nr:MAG: glycosyltransferase [Pseudomonadota bacterium]
MRAWHLCNNRFPHCNPGYRQPGEQTMGSVFTLPARRFRTVWISDVHLGTTGCKVDYLLDLLRATECDYLYLHLVGDGPDLPMLKRRYPGVRFAGFRFGSELSRYLAAADGFVFPSRTDTFGAVLLEAMACGVPVAAFPVTGPCDVVFNGETGILDEDLGAAVRAALSFDGRRCRAYALGHTWEAATAQFEAHLHQNTRSSNLRTAQQEAR